MGASDLHGSLSGYLCGGARATAQGWLEALHVDVEGPADPAHERLDSLYRACLGQFDATPPRIDPLLPDGGTSVALRANGLVEWCRGFLGGVGLSGATARKALSGDAKEILADIGAIAASHVQLADPDDDENAFRDLLEFTRTAVAVLSRELAGAEPTQSLH